MLFLDVVLRCMRLRSVYGWDQEQRYWDDAAAEVEVSERARESGFGYEIDVAVQIHESWAHIFTNIRLPRLPYSSPSSVLPTGHLCSLPTVYDFDKGFLSIPKEGLVACWQ